METDVQKCHMINLISLDMTSTDLLESGARERERHTEVLSSYAFTV